MHPLALNTGFETAAEAAVYTKVRRGAGTNFLARRGRVLAPLCIRALDSKV
jgi:hypothetical protein